MGHYIPKARLPQLDQYKYSGTDDSYLSLHVLGPWWNWLVQQFPLWVAPNTITISGLGLVGINFVTLLLIDPGLQCGTAAALDPMRRTQALNDSNDRWAPVSLFPNFGFPSTMGQDKYTNVSCIPPWVFYTWAAGLFMYQSLDSIDGKQARRTGMAGPLGELFDHGCDAINTTLECLLCAAALNIGRSYWAIASLVATLSNFYLTTWEEFHTGTLYLSVFSGPVEGIILICIIYTVTAIVPGGVAFWNRGIFSVLGLENTPALQPYNLALNESFLAFGALGLCANIAASYSNVRAARAKQNKSQVTPLFGLLPLVAQMGAMTLWATGNYGQILRDTSVFVPFALAWGIGFAYAVGLLIVAHVTKAPFPYWNIATIFGVIGAIDAWLPQPVLQNSPERVRLAVYTSLGLSALLYLHFCHDVITTITKHTGKPCFRVVSPDAKGKAKAQ